jgi:3',5'-nucleoside bisphosphate phosphatase
VDEVERPLRADFHTHSTASDGTIAPDELVHEAARRGLTHLALTDHDTVRGVHDAVRAGLNMDVHVIPGIELSVEIDRGELHILGYGIDPDNQKLLSTLTELRETRSTRAERILKRLADLGIELDPELLVREHPEDAIGRPHIARGLVEKGVVDSVSDAFDRFLGPGKPAFVSRSLISPRGSIDVIREAGGIAVMAHPHSVPQLDKILPVLVELGLSGLECYYGGYNRSEQEALAVQADTFGLIPTGGSDYHGPGPREQRELGSVDIPRSVIYGFLAAVGHAL